MPGMILEQFERKPCASKWVLIILLSVALALLTGVNVHQARTLQRQRGAIQRLLNQQTGNEVTTPGSGPALRGIAFPAEPLNSRWAFPTRLRAIEEE